MKRRQFLQTMGRTALGACGFTVLSPRAFGANERIGLGFIGVGSLGRGHHLRYCLNRKDLFDVVAVCDVDQSRVDRAVQDTDGKAKGYRDFRQLLDRKDIDAVFIVTPDHWHAIPTIHACQAGKDVYCEKPLSLNVREGRAMVDAVRRYGRIFQTGSQQRSDRRFRWACELVRNGRIGKLQNVRTVIGAGPTTPFEPDQAPPAHLDWDFWLGPAPRTPYTPKRCHYNFRWFYDYSGGKLTDWGAHHNDIAQWGLAADDSGPVEVSGHSTFPGQGLYDTAVDFHVTYRYENGVTLDCVSGGRNGVTFTGTKGKIFVTRGAIEADPQEILDTPPGAGPLALYESDQHHLNFVDCIKTRQRPICDVEIGHRSVTVCHLGNIAVKLGRQLRWDPEREEFKDDEAANRLLGKPMRAPWSL